MHRITDFGEAREVETIEESMTMTSGVGTPFYMAPEMATGSKHYTGAVDVYSFAIMAAQVMVGKLVFEVNDFATPYCLFFLSFEQSFVCFTFSLVEYSICECSLPRCSSNNHELLGRAEAFDFIVLGFKSIISSLFVLFDCLSVHLLWCHFVYFTAFKQVVHELQSLLE